MADDAVLKMRVGWSPVSVEDFQSTCRAEDGCSYRLEIVRGRQKNE